MKAKRKRNWELEVRAGTWAAHVKRRRLAVIEGRLCRTNLIRMRPSRGGLSITFFARLGGRVVGIILYDVVTAREARLSHSPFSRRKLGGRA